VVFAAPALAGAFLVSPERSPWSAATVAEAGKRAAVGARYADLIDRLYA
jgi:hypothetical protein